MLEKIARAYASGYIAPPAPDISVYAAHCISRRRHLKKHITPHTGCDNSCQQYSVLQYYFNLHTPYGVQRTIKNIRQLRDNFNSHTPYGVRPYM